MNRPWFDETSLIFFLYPEIRISVVHKQSLEFILWRRFSIHSANTDSRCLWRNVPQHRHVEYSWCPSRWTVSRAYSNWFAIHADWLYSTKKLRSFQKLLSVVPIRRFLGCERIGSPPSILNPIRSAKLRTIDSFAFKYGKVEISAKMPAGDWLHPGWLALLRIAHSSVSLL